MKEISIREVKENFVSMISDQWALLAAGKMDNYNMMTVSWGGIGELWGKDVCFVFVRPQRYTFEYMEQNEYFTLSFYGGEYKKELGICGSKSGRDTDKTTLTGFEPVEIGDSVSLKQAKITVLLRKIAYQDMNPDGFLAPEIMSNYAASDFHRTYVGEIIKVIVDE